MKWIGKKGNVNTQDARYAEKGRSIGTLTGIRAEAAGAEDENMFDSNTNVLFHCDAVDLLERLPDKSVGLIYMDPPWGLAHEGFAGDDRDATVTSHQKHVVMLSKCLQQARRVLSATGSVAVHWSPVSPLDIRLILNQAFGAQPRYEITWQRGSRSRTAQAGPKVDSEFFLVYSESTTPVYNPIFRPLSADEESAFGTSDARGKYRLVDLTVPFVRPNRTFIWHGASPGERRSWRYSKEILDRYARESLIHFPSSDDKPRLKQYLSASAGIEIGTTWTDIPQPPRSRSSSQWPAQQPIDLLRRIIELASNHGDRVLDLFCGSGTALIAASHLARYWWGAEISPLAWEVIERRLASECGLRAGSDFQVHEAATVLGNAVVFAAYRDVLSSVDDIHILQQEVRSLTTHVLNLKRLMNIGSEASDERVDDVLKEMEHWISTTLSHRSVHDYVSVVCAWLAGWDQLETASQSFLPQAEMLYEGIAQSDAEDFSPFIIQYCRALENEILAKLFAAYTENVSGRKQELGGIVLSERDDEKTGRFARSLQKGDVTYSLGDMSFILGLLREGGATLRRSPLLQDFREFVVRYFGERVLDREYLDQIDAINRDFRRKAAHPYILGAEAAQRCRDQVRRCLNELILLYRKGQPPVVE